MAKGREYRLQLIKANLELLERILPLINREEPISDIDKVDFTDFVQRIRKGIRQSDRRRASLRGE